MRFNRNYIVFCLLFMCWSAQAQMVRVAAVVDGDRIVLSDGRRIQLLGVDAPERHRSVKQQQDALPRGLMPENLAGQGAVAASFAAAIASGMHARLTHEPLPSSIDERVFEGYQPAYVYIVDPGGAVLYSLNERMLAEGYAIAERRFPFTRQRDFLALEQHARSNQLGLWGPMADQPIQGSGNARESAGADAGSSCRTNTGCVWVSLGGGAGSWESRPGYRCPCAKR